MMLPRNVSPFKFLKKFTESTIDILAQAYIDKKFNISMDRNYEMDIIAIDTNNDNCNNKLSTRRRRKISNQLGIPRSNFIVNKKNSHERDLILKNKDYYVLLLIYDSNEVVKSVHLIKHIFNHENLFSGNNILNNKMKSRKKRPAIISSYSRNNTNKACISKNYV